MNEQVTLFPILKCDFIMLIKRALTGEPSFTTNPEDAIPGTLTYNCTHEIGQEACKSAFKAQCVWGLPTEDGHVRQEWAEVVLKCIIDYVPSSGDITPLLHNLKFKKGVEESYKILQEANTMAWVSLLMGEVYKFVDKTIETHGERPLFKIPRMQMVNAFVTMCNRAGGLTEEIGRMTLSGTYLVEEIIENRGSFIKYINNTSSCILLQQGTEGYKIALFLSFAQHVQYIATGWTAFVANFQGEHFGIYNKMVSLGNQSAQVARCCWQTHKSSQNHEFISCYRVFRGWLEY